jgi:hypothetical protein
VSIYSDKSPFSFYLDLLGTWPTGIALASQWLIYFDFSNITRNNGLMGSIQSSLRNRESGAEWTYDSNVTNYLLDGKVQTSVDNMMGCAFARQVQLPGENIEASNQGLDYGGFLAPATASNRGKYEPLSVTLLETNASFLDFIIRPWVISVGYNGLVARGSNSPKNVKCNFADVVMFAKTGAFNPMQVRKVYRFYNVAPIALPGETYSYQEEGLKYGDVKFAYDRYAVLDGNTGNLLALP